MLRHLLFALGACAICAVAAPRCEASSESPGAGPPSLTAEQHIKRELAENTECDFAETPLKDVMDYIKERHKFEIQFDTPNLQAANPPIDPSQTLVTMRVHGISLRSALNLMLENLALEWVIHDEVLLITSKEAAEKILVPRVFDVSDLVAAERADALDSIRQTLIDAVAPESWKANGGLGSIHGFAKDGVLALVVLQTDKNQDRIEQLLGELRRLRVKPAPKP